MAARPRARAQCMGHSKGLGRIIILRSWPYYDARRQNAEPVLVSFRSGGDMGTRLVKRGRTTMADAPKDAMVSLEHSSLKVCRGEE